MGPQQTVDQIVVSASWEIRGKVGRGTGDIWTMIWSGYWLPQFPFLGKRFWRQRGSNILGLFEGCEWGTVRKQLGAAETRARDTYSAVCPGTVGPCVC